MAHPSASHALVHAAPASLADPAAAAGDGPLILFDGVCGLCHAGVDFVIAHDVRARFRFAPLQSATGAAVLRHHRLHGPRGDSVALLDRGRLHLRSDAVLHILRGLGPPWSLAVVFIIIPRPLRDLAYRGVARVRYRLFGRVDACRLPSRAQQRLFLS